MRHQIDLAFQSADLEKQFTRTVRRFGNEKIGGLLFYYHDQIAGLHPRRHQAIFGETSFGLISHWLVCPNVAQFPKSNYEVADAEQLAAIGEMTVYGNYLMWMFWNSHPRGNSDYTFRPTNREIQFWKENCPPDGWYSPKGAIVTIDPIYDEAEVTAYTRANAQAVKFDGGRFLGWKYIRSKIKRYYKDRGLEVAS
ncbi:hypothetical protein Rctr85_081 [Virus Rctr85]|nr:hypothetical protein Rctr85_081 [Virus Rctr85]